MSRLARAQGHCGDRIGGACSEHFQAKLMLGRWSVSWWGRSSTNADIRVADAEFWKIVIEL